MGNHRVKFLGWEHGMRKIPFIHLLTELTDLDLAEAKAVKDSVVNDDNEVIIEVASGEVAKEIVERSRNLGVICQIE